MSIIFLECTSIVLITHNIHHNRAQFSMRNKLYKCKAGTKIDCMSFLLRELPPIKLHHSYLIHPILLITQYPWCFATVTHNALAPTHNARVPTLPHFPPVHTKISVGKYRPKCRDQYIAFITLYQKSLSVIAKELLI